MDAGKAQPPFGGSRATAVAAVAAAAVVLAACGSSPGALSSDVLPVGAAAVSPAPASVSQTLEETGSSLMAPLFALWAPAYHARFSQVTLHTKSSSSPGAAIVPVHRADGSGSTFLFTSYLNAQDPSGWNSSLIGTTVAWPRRPGALGATGSDAVISSVKSAPGAIGYVGVSYLSQVINATEGEAALGNSAGSFVLPTARAIQAALASFTNTPASETISLINGSAAQAYPVVNYEHAVVNTSQPSATRAQDLRAFLTWAVTSGREQLGQVNFQPLPSSIVTLSDTQIAEIKG